MTTPDEPLPDGTWSGTGPPPPTWDAGDPVVTSEGAAGSAPAESQADPPTAPPPPTPGPSGPSVVSAASGSSSGVRWRWIAVGGAVVVVAVVAGLIVHAHRARDDRAAAAATTVPSGTSGSGSGSGSGSTSTAGLGPTYLPFTSADPAFTISTPGPAERKAGARNVRFGPAPGAAVRWTLEVRPAAVGLDLSAALAAVAARRGGTATPIADTSTVGTHLDEVVTGADGGALVHLAEGTDHLFVLTVPRRAGGNAITARTVFDRMARSLQAPGVGP